MANEAKEFALAVKAFSTANKETSNLAAATFGKDGSIGKGVDKLVTRLNLQFAADAAKKTKDFIMERKMKRQEMKMLRDRLGLTKEDFKVMMTTKRNNDAFKKMQESFEDAAQNLLGFDPELIKELNERDEQGRFRSTENMIAAIDMTRESLAEEMRQNNILQEGRINMARRTQRNRAAAEEEQAEANAAEERRTSLFESMVEGIGTLNKSFMDGMKKTGKFAFAGLIALIAAPVVALANFFGQLAVEFAYLGRLAKGGLNILFKPFAALLRFFPNLNAFLIRTGTSIKAAAKVMAPQNLGRNIRSVVTTLKNFFEPVTKFFSTIFRNVKTFVNASRTASGILKFAAKFGTVLGKLFLPLTIVMSAFDFITGFIDGFKESEGNNIVSRFIDGVGGGLSKLVGNLIGIPLDLLKSGVSFIAGMLGFEEAEKFLDSFSFTDFITDIVKLPYTLLSKAVDYIVGVFTGENDLVGDIVGGLGNLMDTAKQFIKDMLRKILPNPKGNLLSKLASKAIPDSVYEFAGIDPDTGQIIPDPPEPPATAEPDTEGARKDLEKEVTGGGVTVETTRRRRRSPEERDKAIAASKERRQQRLEAARERRRMRDAQDEMNAGGKGQVAVNAPNVNAPTTTNSSSTTVTSTAMKPKEPTTQAAIQSAYM